MVYWSLLEEPLSNDAAISVDDEDLVTDVEPTTATSRSALMGC